MIYLLWPTARPMICLQTHTHWIRTADTPQNIITKIAVDTEQDKAQLAQYGYDVTVVQKNHPGVAFVTHALSSVLVAEARDIVILASDDFFSPDHWDTWILNQFSDFDGCLMVNDGYQEGGCITIPIMTYSCLLKLNKIIYHPSYRHQFSDAELWVNLNEMGLIKNLRKHPTVFEHRHWASGKRQFDTVDNLACQSGGYDSQNYETRCRLPLSERLKV